MEKQNLFAGIPAALSEELTESVLDGGRLRIERIVSRGQSSPPGFWYDQRDHEWVVVLRGEGVLEFEDGDSPVVLGPGDYLNIGAHRRHRVVSTHPEEATVWLAIHY